LERSKVGERLAQAPAQEVVQFLYGPRIAEELQVSFGYLTWVNRAHVVMLEEQEIITREAAVALLNTLDDIEREGPEGLAIDREREDLYFNYEHAVIARVGHAIGGQIHTGRSRNDLGATMSRMRCRDALYWLLQAVFGLRRVLIGRAREHAGTVMPGYTHLQPAQPITLGHYLLAVEGGLERDTDRLRAALCRANYSPLGAAALAGTGFPIDRLLTARLLGFDGLVENTLDCVASRDFLLEAAAAGALLGVTLSRLAQDLYVWYTHEFGMIDFPDSTAGTSSIMPQKKNPVILEHIKGRTAAASGALAGAIAAVQASNYSNTVDANREGLRPVWGALEDLRVATMLAHTAVGTLIARRELMLSRCRVNFSTVTELADQLVRGWGLSFREAHEVVGAVVRQALEQGRDASGITAAMVREAAVAVLGRPKVPALSDDVVRAALDPLANVTARSHVGGPAPLAVAEAADRADGRWTFDSDRLECCRKQLTEAERDLAGMIRLLTGAPAPEEWASESDAD